MKSSIDPKTLGACVLNHSRVLDGVSGSASSAFEKLSTAGRVGRLFNLLRRESDLQDTFTIRSDVIDNLCRLNGIGIETRHYGLRVLEQKRILQRTVSGEVAVLGATTSAVLDFTAAHFEELNPSAREVAAVVLSESCSEVPLKIRDAKEMISDIFQIADAEATELLSVSEQLTFVDVARERDMTLVYNGNTFRDKERAVKLTRLRHALSPDDSRRLNEFDERMKLHGVVSSSQALVILGSTLLERLLQVGVYDCLKVSNPNETTDYISSPFTFQKFGRPFEEDPTDDAKSLLASLTYGQERSNHVRGQIKYPDALVRKLVQGGEVGGATGIRAIGEDYLDLEKRGVVQISKKPGDRFTMRLLKKDVGELALGVIAGQSAAEQSLTYHKPATGFAGPKQSRVAVRSRLTVDDARFEIDAIDSIRFS